MAGGRHRSLSKGTSPMIWLSISCLLVGFVMVYAGGSGSRFDYDLVFGTHYYTDYRSGHSGTLSLVGILSPFIGVGLLGISPFIFTYGIYESVRSWWVLVMGVRGRAYATVVESETTRMASDSVSPNIYYLNYQYSTQSGESYQGQALVTMEDEAVLWRRRIESGKSMFEVIYNPNAPEEHVALFQEALQG